MKSAFRKATTLALLAVGILAVPSGNKAIASKSDCSSVRNLYPFGIALNKQSIGTSRAEVNRKKYIQFKNLDVDFDGIVCELEMLQTGTTTLFTSPTSTPVTVPRATVTTIRGVLLPRTTWVPPVLTPRTTWVPNSIPAFSIPSRPCVFPFIGPSNPNCPLGQSVMTATTSLPPTTTTSLPPTTTTSLPPTTTSSICIPDSYEVSRLNFAIQPWNNNYSRTRALFIYEGRTAAVRMLDSYTQAMRDRYDSAMRSVNSCVRIYWEITNWYSISWPNY